MIDGRTISTDIKQRIATIGYLFVIEGMIVNPSITAINNTLLKARGPVWHKSSMKKGEVLCSGIDTDARRGYSRTKKWIFGYKIYLTCTTGKIIVPLTSDVTPANVQDNQMYVSLVSSSLVFSLPNVLYMIADPGYDDKNIYKYNKKVLGIDLVCPIEQYEVLPKRGLRLYVFVNRQWGSLSTAIE